MSKHCRHSGHVAPAQKFQPFLLCNDLKHLFGLISLQLILREKEGAHTVFPLAADLKTERSCHPDHKLMRHLRENTHAVSRLALRVLSGSVLQILHNLKRILHSGAALFAFDVDAGADTAVVVFKLRPVQRGLRD